MSNLISLQDFSDLYNIPVGNVYVFYHHSKPEWIQKDGKQIMIDIEYLVKRQQHTKKLWLSAHDYYYYFIYALGIKQFKLSRIIAKYYGESHLSWNEFFATALFKINNNSIMYTNISTQMIKFAELSEHLIPLVHKRIKNNKKYRDLVSDLL